ncbi:MAG: CDP-glycerol glycerophosphotransferase family protein [Selenomonadaceae bacterium]|nr:CDP-glycerol glycerophosphotransferase family protein [Selenomonadaceae bacterium]
MKLYQFDILIFESIQCNEIYIINYSEYYLSKLCDAFPVLEYIAGGWDDVPYRQGVHEFRGHRIRITNYENVERVPQSAILLIIDPYPYARFKLVSSKQEISERFSKIYFFADKETTYYLSYIEKYKNDALENIIVFRSGPGASRNVPGIDFGDNARALFEYMLREGYDNEYTLVWLVRDPAKYIEKYEGRNVRFFPYTASETDNVSIREKYYYYLCHAKFIFFTNSGVFSSHARADQVRVQLWHGCGFKNIRSVRIGRDEYKYEYMIVTSKLYAKLHELDFGLRSDQLLVTGYPKDDLLFYPISGWPQKFNIHKAKKYIFWLPTWRTTALSGEWQGEIVNKETGLPIIDTMGKLEEINEFLCAKDIVLVIKLHPWQETTVLPELNLSNVVVLKNELLAKEDVQINELLGHADALISDYSSVAVDYTLLDRPIGFTLDDIGVYKDRRGFLWENIHDWLPGMEIFSVRDFMEFIFSVFDGTDPFREKRRQLDKMFHDFSDARSSSRVLEMLGIKHGNIEVF